MHKYLSLTRVLFKNTAGMMSDGSTKKSRVYILYAFLAVCLLPTFYLIYQMFDYAVEQLIFIRQEGTLLAVGFHICNLVTFLFSIFLIPGVFYFSKDSETLLALPIKPQTILSAKFSVCLVYEYIFTIAIMIPLLIAYLSHVEVSIVFYLIAAIIIIALPIYPLVLSSAFTMLVMRFMPFFKNRDRFNMIAGVITVVLAISFSIFMNSASMSEDPNALLMLLFDGDNSLIKLFSLIFPGVPFAAHALINGDFLQLLIYLIIVAASIAVFIFLGKLLYFKGAIGLNETGSSGKRLSSSDMNKLVLRKNTIHSYMLKELRLIFRTPVYFLNCIGTAFIMPIVFAITFIFGGSGSSLDVSSLTTLIDQNVTFTLSQMAPYAIFVGLIIGLMFANMNFISSTAISREGTNLMFMKYIPMSYGKQIQAKVYCGVLISAFTVLVMAILAFLIVPVIPIALIIICFLASLITNLLGNYLGILIDLIHPKLIWEQEAAAVKQNLTAMLSFFGGFILAIGLGAIMIFIPVDSIWISVSITTLVLVILCVISYICMPKLAAKLLLKL